MAHFLNWDDKDGNFRGTLPNFFFFEKPELFFRKSSKFPLLSANLNCF